MNNYWVDNKITGGWQEIQEKFREFVKIENNIIYLLNTGIQIKIKYNNDKNFILSENNLQENIENKQPTEFNINWNEGYYLLNQSLLNLCFNTKKTKAEVIDDYKKEDNDSKIELETNYKLKSEDIFLNFSNGVKKFLKEEKEVLSYNINFPKNDFKLIKLKNENSVDEVFITTNKVDINNAWLYGAIYCEKSEDYPNYPFKIKINNNILYKKSPYLFLCFQSGGGNGSDSYFIKPNDDKGEWSCSGGGCGGGGGSFGIVLLSLDPKKDLNQWQFQIRCIKEEGRGEDLELINSYKTNGIIIKFFGGKNGNMDDKIKNISPGYYSSIHPIEIYNYYTPGEGGKIKVYQSNGIKILFKKEGEKGIKSNRWVHADATETHIYCLKDDAEDNRSFLKNFNREKKLYTKNNYQIKKINFYKEKENDTFFKKLTTKTIPYYENKFYYDSASKTNNNPNKDIACGGLGGYAVLSNLHNENNKEYEKYTGFGYGGDGDNVWENARGAARRTVGGTFSYFKEGGKSCWCIIDDDFKEEFKSEIGLFEEEM